MPTALLLASLSARVAPPRRGDAGRLRDPREPDLLESLHDIGPTLRVTRTISAGWRPRPRSWPPPTICACAPTPI
jgi:hypothetical protein